jgi:hypothetical protein
MPKEQPVKNNEDFLRNASADYLASLPLRWR